jgi:hypothetical protein
LSAPGGIGSLVSATWKTIGRFHCPRFYHAELAWNRGTLLYRLQMIQLIRRMIVSFTVSIFRDPHFHADIPLFILNSLSGGRSHWRMFLVTGNSWCLGKLYYPLALGLSTLLFSDWQTHATPPRRHQVLDLGLE